MERAFPFVSDDGLERSVGVRELARNHESDRPVGQRAKEAGVTPEEGAKVVAGGRQHEVQEHRSPGRIDADRVFVGERITDG